VKDNAVQDLFGLKGRFCKARPQAWEKEKGLFPVIGPERAVHDRRNAHERPFQDRNAGETTSPSQAFGLIVPHKFRLVLAGWGG